MNSYSITTGVTGSSSSICETFGSTVIFGIWKTSPAPGNVPFEMESIDALTLSANPFTTSRSWRVGINPGLSVDAVAAAMYARDVSDPRAAATWCIKNVSGDTTGLRDAMKLTGFGAAAACTSAAASTVSAVVGSVTVFSTASPSVDGVGVASASSDDGSEFSGEVFAATFDTRAESNAGLCVQA